MNRNSLSFFVTNRLKHIPARSQLQTGDSAEGVHRSLLNCLHERRQTLPSRPCFSLTGGELAPLSLPQVMPPPRIFGPLFWGTLWIIIFGVPVSGQTISVSGNGRTISHEDLTPNSLDHTAFGAVGVGEGVIDRTFTIENIGGRSLLIFTIERIGGSPGNFTIPVPPAQVLNPGAITSFTVRFFPSLPGGVRSTSLRIRTNDPETPFFTYRIQGTALVPEPEINILGNGQVIEDGDSFPSSADHTDFGSIDIDAGPLIRTFTLQNIGEAPLNITKVELTDGSSADFAITSFPVAQLPQGSQFPFEVSFDPSATGLQKINVRIHSTDSDEGIFDFVLQGRGTTAAGEVSVFGNGVLIPDGAGDPSAADHTKFESTRVGVTSRRSFTIENTGTASLTVSSIVVFGGQAGDFSIPSFPTAPLGPGESFDFEVIFQPSTLGEHSTTLRIFSNDPATPVHDIALFGAGGAFELLRVERDGDDAIIIFRTNPDTEVSNYFYTIHHSTTLESWTALQSLPSSGGTLEQYRHVGGYLEDSGYWKITESVIP